MFCITTDKMVRTTFAITLTDKYYRTMTQEMESRMALKDLVDRYATESDKNNQDYYRNLFRPDVKLKVYMGDKQIMDMV